MHQQNTQTLSVSELNRQVRQLLESGFSVLNIEGEISNFVCPSSGHWYFTLKDQGAQVRCALFKNRNRFLKYKPRNGDQVKLRAKVSLYEGRGEFQLIGDYLEEAGAGALQAAFEALKIKLEQEGLFSQQHKRPLPTLPRHIGVITSPTGAAVRDIVSVLARRFPAIPVSIFPVAVQGEEAPQQLIDALNLANRDGRCDVIILGRGGGSLEDLWAFNNELLARAIFASDIPIVSAVGHEVDFSISDFVADLRAPTPSAAAELLSPDRETLGGQLRYYEEALARQFKRRIELLSLRLKSASQRLRHPGQRLQEQAQRLDELELRLKRQLKYSLNLYQQRLSHLDYRLTQQSPDRKIDYLQTRQQELYQRLKRGMSLQLDKRRVQLASQSHALQAVSPLATLSRGYAIVSDQQGHIVRNTSDISIGDTLQTRLAKGRLLCQVTETIEADH
ncbi:exodeoxyribonuclease VII large subunit [Motiliproteus sp. MSK22-1]|uniref:exodeoxyribonuclease VII large subunit n=1 Tax=Motiliproteus sp. MSK22-1 TaxID=1897630 RepID=UPI00097662D7|nr:exodeoxyribonuclease VII large subunit [Motiliproteus sp. MSK22-1]OMH33959.1 exodeoxyribonuclease VII large subunit [Motiliproteus sp. MSK22-1]